MKTLLRSIVCVLALSQACLADPWIGKLDLFSGVNPLPQPIAIRELHDGNWLAGIQKQIWHLETRKVQVLHASYYQAWRTAYGDPAYGLSLGTDLIGDAKIVLDLANIEVPEPPQLFSDIKTFVSVDFYGGYRPVHGADVHAWIYGIGGKVTIPWDLTQHH